LAQATPFAANIDLAGLNGSDGFKFSGVAGDNAGISVASAGDVNGDGVSDIIIGAPYASPHGFHSGASYGVFGNTSGFAADVNLSTLDGTNGFKISDEAAGDGFRIQVSGAGDVDVDGDGDGFADVLIGAFGASPHGTWSGASYVVHGRPGGFDSNIDLSGIGSVAGL
jgi:hypothetical protein